MERMELRPAGGQLPVHKKHIDLTAHQFAEAIEDAWYYTPLQAKDGFGRVDGDLWVVGDWLFSDVQLPPALFQTEHCHILERSTHISLERFIFGDERGRTQDDRNILNTPGEVSFCDERLLYESIVSERRVHDVTVPRALLGLTADEPAEFPNIQAATAFGQFVFAEWDAIYLALNRGDATLPQSQLNRLAACLKIAMGVHPQREDVRTHAREALFRQICCYIETHLEDPHLSTSTLLDKFGVSRATLYRMFEPMGGVRNYLTERRAASALFFISRNQGHPGSVQAACERWSFSSPANFNRTIQRLYGNSPKALLFSEDEDGRERFSPTNFITDYCAVRYHGDSDSLSALAA